MATCNFIKESKQTPSAMRAVIRYVSQEKKTVDENGVRYLSGVNCVGTLAFDEFMATKNLYRKKNGIFFYQYTQSFAPGEIKSYAGAHEIGQELAREFFPGYEVLVATHLDAVSDGERRIHNHLIVNSVSFENGKKLHCDNHTLERMRKISDRICAEHGLSVLEPYVQTYEKKAIGTREYRAALKDESWKIRLIRDINTAMTRCGSCEEFCDMMCAAGYSVTWKDSRKYITYTCPNGMKVRDNKLHDEKYLKENMEDEFRIREKNTAGQSIEQVQGIYTDNGSTVSADRICDSERGMDRVPRLGEGSRDFSANDLPKAIDADNNGRQRSDSRGHSNRAGKDSKKHEVRDGENDIGHSLRARTGWENERAVYDRFLQGNEVANGEIQRLVFEDAAVYDHHDRGDSHRLGATMYDRLSFDEINAFFSDEPEDWDDISEDDLYATGKQYMISKNIPKAIEYFERSASKGNIYAYCALCRMNENVIVALTTDIAYIVSGLAGLFHDSMPIEDSTMLPHHREKKKHGHKQSM